MSAIFRLLRPRQWTKNVLVFAAIFFSYHFREMDAWISTVQMFIVFSLVASGIYIINDLCDVKKDRLHPEKKNRPIASGEVKPRTALVLAIILLAVGIGWAWTFNSWAFTIIAGYSLLMIFYSLKLKQILLLDVFIIAGGFTARALAGAAVIEVEISKWLMICAFFIGLTLALIKRRQELARLGDDTENGRLSLQKAPPLRVWDLWISMVSAITIICYTLYTFDPITVGKIGSQKLLFTTPFVVFALLRYQVSVYTEGKGEDPTETVLTDPWVQVAVLGWAVMVILILTGNF